uniref:Amino acid permease n=1 Tax=Panagrellus redivivus TaxID=6233 RepID=A0A7E4W600_PANRE
MSSFFRKLQKRLKPGEDDVMSEPPQDSNDPKNAGEEHVGHFGKTFMRKKVADSSGQQSIDNENDLRKESKLASQDGGAGNLSQGA